MITKEEILERFKARAAESGAAFEELADANVGHLTWLAGELADVVTGDERAQAHLKAQVAGFNFQAQATTYLEAVAWRNAIIKVAEELVTELADVGLELALGFLVDGLKGMA